MLRQPFFFLLYFLSHLSNAQLILDVVELGAIAGGSTNSAPAFLSAWSLACKSPNYSIISVPRGNFLLTETTFEGPCLSPITIKLAGTLISGDTFRFSRDRWIVFNGIRGLSIHGGTLDGRGGAVYSCKAANLNCPAGATVHVLLPLLLIHSTLIIRLSAADSHVVQLRRCLHLRIDVRQQRALSCRGSWMPESEGGRVKSRCTRKQP